MDGTAQVFHQLSASELFSLLEVDPRQGLSHSTAILRQQEYGFNILPHADKNAWWRILLRQFFSIIVILMLFAAGLSVVFDHAVDAVVIAGIVLVNVGIGFYQEWKAEKAVLALKQMVVTKAKVLRDGDWVYVDPEELVPGDVIQLQDGDKVPADARVIKAEFAQVMEAALTGESTPVDKDPGSLPLGTVLAERTNMVFMGTLVARGKMEAVVVGTGLNTELGLVAAQLKGMKEQPSHYEKRTAQLSKIMAITAVILGLVTFAVGYWWRGFELFEMVTYTVATLVSALPESLPIILVVVLALGAVRMAKKHAIVRKLSATETLGVVSVIITDKTGTLTQNVMSVGAVAIPGSGVITVGGKVVIADFGLVKKIAVLGTGVEKVMKHGEGEVLTGDPTEVALYSFGMTGPAAYLSGYEKIQDLPFDPKLKLRASLVKGEAEASPELFVVGAPEVVMRKCTAMVTATGKKMLCNEKIAQEMLNELASKGMRTVGLAIRKVPKGTKKIDIKTQLQELTMVGVVGLYDPPREEVAPALRAGAKAGIHIVMATGDHPVTAGVIAQKIGLIPADISACVLTESEIEKMNDAQLWDELQTCQVLARLSPDSKLRVAGLFQDHGYVVAMTGDGVNDAPALKKADVGIAMGKVGTDVAREASDIVLADDNFATIINAIAEGRTQFSNVRRTTYFLLATNVSECAALLVTLLFGLPMPLLPLQILWLNVVATGITDIALATEPSHENVMDYPPRDPKEALITSRFMPLFVSITISMVIAVIGVFVWFLPQGVAYARTAAFITLSLAQLSNLFSMRSLRLSVLRIGLFSNKAVNIAVAVSLLLMLAATYTPYFNDIFSFKPLAFFEMMVIVAVAASIFLLTEVVKHFFAAGSRFTPTAFFVKPTGVRR